MSSESQLVKAIRAEEEAAILWAQQELEREETQQLLLLLSEVTEAVQQSHVERVWFEHLKRCRCRRCYRENSLLVATRALLEQPTQPKSQQQHEKKQHKSFSK